MTLPAGTVTFLLTDVEGSTRLWATAPQRAAAMLDRQRQLIGAAVAAHGGQRPEEQGEGDSVAAVFGSATAALAAALDAQRAIVAEPWPDDVTLRVRMGLHTGEAHLRDERNYTGVALHRCARIRDIGHGGQTLLSSATASVVADSPPEGSGLLDMGFHRLRDLASPERVYALVHSDLPGEFPPLRSLDVLPNNLPEQLTSFVGRDEELNDVQKLVADERLVTLTGAGGCGKTRLAVQAAADMADRWPDGAWWIDLAPVSDPALVAHLCASTIGVLVEPTGGPLRALQSQLRDRRLLMCLDNCEHLVDACAELVDELLRACSEVTVLATSREPLRLPGEAVWRVPSMVASDAARLFADRARRVRPGFTLEADEDAVHTICERLDGIPLAVELAAAWVRALTPAQIAAGLDDRLRLLADAPRGVAARQQTLRASIDWSHDLLTDAERAGFRRLAVFAGGFTLDAATAVCAAEPIADDDILTVLVHLVDKSLVIAGERGGESRYRPLETIRQYATDRLEAAGESAPTRDRHLDHYLVLAESAEPELEQADQDAWLDRLEAEHDNLRAALEWGLSAHDPERGRRLAAALPRLWFVHGHSHEGTELLQRAIARAPDDRSTMQARLLSGIAMVTVAGGQFSLTVDATRRGLEIATANGDDRNRGRCLVLAAYVQLYLDLDGSLELSREGQRLAEADGDLLTADMGLVMEALVLRNQDRHDEARTRLESVVERSLRRGDRIVAAYGRTGQAVSAVLTGDVRLAEERAVDAVGLAEPLGDYFTLGQATSILAWVKGIGGDIDDGLRLMRRVVRSVESAGPDVDVPSMALTLGELHLWAGDLENAVAWLRQGARYGAPLTDNLMAARSRPRLGAALRRLGHLDEAREHVDLAVGLAKRLGLPNVRADALDEQARLVGPDQSDRAEDLHHEALAVRVEHGVRGLWPDSLDALAGSAARAESFAEAARLLSASDAARSSMGRPRPPLDQPVYDATVAALRAALGGDQYRSAWSEGAALSLDEAVAYATRARGRRARPSTGWASLTPVERDVVRLVAEGLTNPEIGARLFISRATVKTHVSHIYAKLGVANRTELAAMASARSAG